MPRQLDPEGATLLLTEVAKLGVQVLLGRQTSHIAQHAHGLQLCFHDHEALSIDILVISAGIAPRAELAANAGLQCGPRGAVIVDDSLRTSDPHIYAIGECAAHRGQVYGLAAPAYVMADVVVDRLLGKKATFSGADLSTRLKLLGVDVTVLGDHLQPGTTAIHRAPGVYRKLVLRDGRLVGTIAVGPWSQIGQAQTVVQDQRRLRRRHLARFTASGDLWPDAMPPIQQWSDKTVVCNCCRVTKEALLIARQAGAISFQALARATGASTVCGSCRPLVAEIAGAPEGIHAPFRTSRALKWVALVGIAVVVLLAILPPLPIVESVQAWWYGIESFRRDHITKQVTGYFLLALSLAALFLSLRKRWKRFAFGAFASWRLAHALLGVTTLVGLVAHTGLRFGSNLNFVLMNVFVTLNVLGAVAAWVAAMEGKDKGRLAYWARRWRPVMTFVHILLFWLLPALLMFHILAVYYF